jgi:NAD(P)H-hydrate epimerase
MPIPVLTVAQMRQWEKATWVAGAREETVMRRAGQAVARAAESLTRSDDFVLFLAGKGHNGDDTAFAAEYITERRKELLRAAEPEFAERDLEPLLARRPALIIDGLFGIGLNRPLSPAWSGLIELINHADRPVLAVDVPSGLDADSGLPLGAAIRATVTLTLGAVKRGLISTAGAPFVGRLEIARDIGLVPCPFTTDLAAIVPEDFRDYPPRRPAAGHKGTFGHLAILAGSRGFHGAAVLAARGAQRAQPGLITLQVPESIYTPVAAQLQAVMVQPYSQQPELPGNVTALLVGPGLAQKDLPRCVREAAVSLWQRSQVPVIADASALDWLPPGATTEQSLRVITPHPGEAARMLGGSTADVQSDRPTALRALSQKFGGCWVVLKGHQTLTGRGSEPLAVNLSGNPRLAQGGSGDVLAGYIAGLLAQPELQKDPCQALHFAVWQHGATADQLLGSKPNFTMEELAERLGCVEPLRLVQLIAFDSVRAGFNWFGQV